MKFSLVLLSLVRAALAYHTSTIRFTGTTTHPPSDTDPATDTATTGEEQASGPGTSITIGNIVGAATGVNSVSVGGTENEAAGSASGENMALAAAAMTPGGLAFGFAQ